jgi:hypothetical protein
MSSLYHNQHQRKSVTRVHPIMLRLNRLQGFPRRGIGQCSHYDGIGEWELELAIENWRTHLIMPSEKHQVPLASGPALRRGGQLFGEEGKAHWFFGVVG